MEPCAADVQAALAGVLRDDFAQRRATVEVLENLHPACVNRDPVRTRRIRRDESFPYSLHREFRRAQACVLVERSRCHAASEVSESASGPVSKWAKPTGLFT